LGHICHTLLLTVLKAHSQIILFVDIASDTVSCLFYSMILIACWIEWTITIIPTTGVHFAQMEDLLFFIWYRMKKVYNDFGIYFLL